MLIECSNLEFGATGIAYRACHFTAVRLKSQRLHISYDSNVF